MGNLQAMDLRLAKHFSCSGPQVQTFILDILNNGDMNADTSGMNCMR